MGLVNKKGTHLCSFRMPGWCLRRHVWSTQYAEHGIHSLVENWNDSFNRLAGMDVDKILPAHGDVSSRADVKELASMIGDEYATVKDAVARGTNSTRPSRP